MRFVTLTPFLKKSLLLSFLCAFDEAEGHLQTVVDLPVVLVDRSFLLGCILMHFWRVFDEGRLVNLLLLIFCEIVIVVCLIPVDIELSGTLFLRYKSVHSPPLLFLLVK
jgi:hypothetical protein